MATEDTLSVYRPLQTETGWINIVKESDDKVSLVKNVSGGTVIVIPASISGDSLFYTYNRKVAAYITETVNATVDVVVSGKGRLYRSSTLVINESYRGVTPADTLAYEVFNKDFRITTEIPLVFGDNEYRKILVSGDNITTAAEKNK